MGLERNYGGDHLVAEGDNIRLMNTGGDWSWFPLHGAVTDLAVWDRILTTTEMTAWARCEKGGPGSGNVVSWDQVELRLSNITESTINKTELCRAATAKENIQAFTNKNDFYGSQRFCKSLAAKMAVAEDEGSLKMMNRTQAKVCGEGWFYAGYTEVDGEDKWMDVNTGQPLAWENWAQGEPNNWGGNEDCIGSSGAGAFYDVKCETKTCPICKGRPPTKT